MTVSTTSTLVSLSGNGSTHSFAFNFKIFADGDLKVIVKNAAGVATTKTIETHYIITGTGAESGGNVLFKFNTGTTSDSHYSVADNRPAAGETVFIKRDLDLTQSTDYVENDPFSSTDHENALDRLTMASQQLQEQINRKVGVSETTLIIPALPDPIADRVVGVWNSDGSAIEIGPTAADIAAASSNATAAAGSATAAAGSASSASTSATSATTSKNAAATSASGASTSATASAASAALISAGTASTTSLAIGTGSKAFTIAAGLGINVGDFLLATSNSGTTNYMHGQVSAYSSTTLTINVLNVGGSGTKSDWTIRVSGIQGSVGSTGPQGSTGSQGPAGEMGGPDSSTDNAIARFNGTGGSVVQNTGWTISDGNALAAGGVFDMSGHAITLDAVTLSGAVTGADQIVSAINLKDYGEVTQALGSAGGTRTVNLNNGNSVTATVSASANTFVFSNPTAGDELCGFTLGLTNGGSQTVNWPSTVDWTAATAPTLTASGVDWLVFWTVDGGTIWNGKLVGAAFA